MASTGLQLLIGGQWLRSRGAWGDLAYSFIWPGGCRDMQFTATTKYSSRLSLLKRGADAQILWGGWPIWRGYLLEPEWNGNTVTVTANGLYRRGENFPAFDSPATMNATTNPTVALTSANTIGLGWTIDASVPNTTLAITPDGLQTVSSLLDLWTRQLGQRWWVDQFGTVKFAADPVTPSWIVRNGAGDLGIADDDYASNVVLRYNDSGAGAFKSAAYPTLGIVDAYGAVYGTKVSVQDITDQGAMSAATANALALNTYLITKQRPGWTNGLELGHGDLLTPGGVPVHPASVDAFGRMVRVHGVPDEVTLTSWTDFVVANTSYTDGGSTVTVNPIDLAARTTEDVLTELISAALSTGAIT
jgi:hypothetical protein